MELSGGALLSLVPYYGFTGKSFDNLFDLVAGVLVR